MPTIYKLAWFLTPIIFIFFFLLKGEFCFMYSCTGNDVLGIVYGLGAVIIYCLLVKFIKVLYIRHSGRKINWHYDFWGRNNEFFYALLVLILLSVYFFGKMNS